MDILTLIEGINMTKDELLQTLTTATATLEKVSTEITAAKSELAAAKSTTAALQAAIVDLEARLVANEIVEPDIQAAAEAVRTAADSLDALLP